jgi:SEC-C motif-containing protein
MSLPPLGSDAAGQAEPSPLPATAACPCGRLGAKRQPLSYAACCQPWHAGQPAPDAEALMRSRYSAFVLGLTGYLSATWHPSTRPADLSPEPGVRWLGLEVRSHRQQDSTHATVEFVARSRLAGRGQRLHETSRFVLDNGRWLYVDGDLH